MKQSHNIVFIVTLIWIICAAVVFLIALGWGFCATAGAEETYKYIVYRDSFPVIADKVDISTVSKRGDYTYLQDLGYSRRSQPAEETQFIVVRNTDVVILEVTFKNTPERTLYQKMENESRLFLYEVSSAVTGYNARGEWGTMVERRISRRIPVDLINDWSVKRSSQ